MEATGDLDTDISGRLVGGRGSLAGSRENGKKQASGKESRHHVPIFQLSQDRNAPITGGGRVS